MFAKQRHVFVYNKTRETFLSFRVRVCDSVIGRMVGLLGRRSLPPDGGAWIVPANSIHTIGMLFSFDLILIDKNFKVVGLRELIRPFRITWPRRAAESVLELPAHTIFRSRTQIGDQLLIERYEPRKSVAVDGSEREPVQAPIQELASQDRVVPIGPQSVGAEQQPTSFAAKRQ